MCVYPCFLSGVTAWESLLAHVVTQGVLMGIQAALALIMMFLVFKVPCVGYMGDVIFLVFITGMTGMCFGKYLGRSHEIPSALEKCSIGFIHQFLFFPGFFVSVSCETVTTANFLSLGSFYPIILLSGKFHCLLFNKVLHSSKVPVFGQTLKKNIFL